MVEKMKYVANELVNVCYSYNSQGLFVINKRTGQTKVFGGWDGLYDLFKTFYNSFSEEITFDDAVKFFSPTVGTQNVIK